MKGNRSRGRYRYLFIFAAFLSLFVLGVLQTPLAQISPSDYQTELRPDMWYNQTDGIRVGGVFRGQKEPTIAVTPRTVNLGVWVGTGWPDHPLSYYLNWKEPVFYSGPSFAPAYLEVSSSIRTGFHDHQITLFKRWAKQQEKKRFLEIKGGFRATSRHEKAYLLYPQLWQDRWLSLGLMDGRGQISKQGGTLSMHSSIWVNVPIDHDAFIRSEIALNHEWFLNDYFTLRSRLFAGFSSTNTPPELQWMRSMPSSIKWTNGGFFRAKGTIPNSWMNKALIQPVGGPYLRGYYRAEVERLIQNKPVLLHNVTAINLELEYPNPVNKIIENIPLIRDFVRFSSYVFFDAGTNLEDTGYSSTDHFLSDAGTGFELSLNIPDYRNKARGFFIRYDLPFWLSSPPAGTSSVELRHIIGFGSVFTF